MVAGKAKMAVDAYMFKCTISSMPYVLCRCFVLSISVNPEFLLIAPPPCSQGRAKTPQSEPNFLRLLGGWWRRNQCPAGKILVFSKMLIYVAKLLMR